MKIKYLPFVIAFFILGISACQKENNKYAVVGKWQETKLRMYETDSTGVFLYDTTFLQPFTSSDYLQFNNDGTCVISNDYYYYANQDGKQIPPQKIPATSALMNYTAIGSKFVLTPHTRVINPGGFDVRDTVSNSNSNVLLLHSILYSHAPGYRVVSDAYYTKR